MLSMLVGCGSGDVPIPFPEFESTALTALCRLEVLCGTYLDSATCMTSEQTQPHLYDTLAQDIASGKVNYDGASARTCIDTINGVSSCNRNTTEPSSERSRGSVQRRAQTCSALLIPV